jgi:uncharacterized protein
MLGKITIGGLCIAWLLSAAGDTRLADAAEQGDKDAVRSLLSRKVDVNVAQGDGMTALHWAASHDDLEMTELLLQAGADVKAGTRIGAITPLFMACKNGSAAIIEALLKAGASASSPDEHGTTPLMMGAASGSADAVKILLDHGVDVNAKEAAHGQTALIFAAALNRDAAIRVLVEHGADLKAATNVVDPGCGSVFDVSGCVEMDEQGNPIKGKEAAAAKTPPENPAGSANEQSSPEMKTLRALVQTLTTLVDELERRSGSEPAKEAAPEEKVSTPAKETKAQTTTAKKEPDHSREDLDTFARALGFKSAEYRVTEPPETARRRRRGATVMGGMTALLFAARDGQMAAARALIEAGADVNDAGGGEKMSPLVMAISNGHYDLGKYLLDHGADPNLASPTGLTALYATVDMQWAPYAWLPQPITAQEQINYLDLMKTLLDHGADPNAKLKQKIWFRALAGDSSWVDPAGATAFWRAAESGDVAAMRLLVAHGADPNIASKAGDTPLMVAAGLGWALNFSRNAPDSWMAAVKYCLELGADVNAVDTKGYTAVHGVAFRGDNEMIKFLVDKGAKVDVKTKKGDTVADMANGPIPHSIPHSDTVALLEKLGSANSHNCRSDQCVPATVEEKKPAPTAKPGVKSESN